MSCLLPILNEDRRMAGSEFLQISPAAAYTYNNVRGAGLRTRDDRVDNLPSAELLENTHEFPGPYMFKVIGRSDDGFVALVVAVAVLLRHLIRLGWIPRMHKPSCQSQQTACQQKTQYLGLHDRVLG
jgi:putative lipoic acid-binding regulatory protein